MTDKHAYLIMAHKNTYVLEKMLELIDDIRNDIFVHIDVKCNDFDFERYKTLIKKSNLIFLECRMDVRWGGYSQVRCELYLLDTALKYGEYLYFHLLSGQDLPLKNQDTIHAICKIEPNISYIECREIKGKGSTERERMIYRRASIARLPEKIVTRNCFCQFINRLWLGIQYYIFKVDRYKKFNLKFGYGSQWFSLTEKHAKILLKNEKIIERAFTKGSCVEEVFAQSILLTFGIQKEMRPNRRCIEWELLEKLHPHVWTIDDFEKLKSSDAFFARKFDENVDKKIIDQVFYYVGK